MSREFGKLWMDFDVLEQFQMCTECHWCVGFDEPGFICRRCRDVAPEIARGCLRAGEVPRCWRCGEETYVYYRDLTTRVRRELFCPMCLQIGYEVHNALEYIDIVRGRRPYPGEG